MQASYLEPTSSARDLKVVEVGRGSTRLDARISPRPMTSCRDPDNIGNCTASIGPSRDNKR